MQQQRAKNFRRESCRTGYQSMPMNEKERETNGKVDLENGKILENVVFFCMHVRLQLVISICTISIRHRREIA